VDFVRPSRPVALRFVAGRGHYETVIAAVKNARTSVWIATANLKELMIEDTRWSLRRRRRGSTSYRSVIEVFDELATAGVEIRLMHAAPPSRPFREELARHPVLGGSARRQKRGARTSGIFTTTSVTPAATPNSSTEQRHDAATQIEGHIAPRKAASRPKSRAPLPRHDPGRFEMRLCPRVHLKAVIVDGEFLYLGSANWTGAGLGAKGTGRRNFELGMVTDDALLLDDVQEIFDRIWSGKECTGCKLRDVCPAPLDVRSVVKRAKIAVADVE
jgi:phosphatidylserine/phosphatidylglycerophosphate/cardiolipin synthase-like enzyme